MNQPTRHVPSAICATCKRRLVPSDQFDGAGEIVAVGFEHQLPAIGEVPCTDLRPILFEAGGVHPEQVSVCDFCGGLPEQAWLYRASDFTVPGDPRMVMIGDWVACQECHTDIAAKSWDRMAERQCRVHGLTLSLGLRTHFIGIFRSFDMHRTGAPTRL